MINPFIKSAEELAVKLTYDTRKVVNGSWSIGYRGIAESDENSFYMRRVLIAGTTPANFDDLIIEKNPKRKNVRIYGSIDLGSRILNFDYESSKSIDLLIHRMHQLYDHKRLQCRTVNGFKMFIDSDRFDYEVDDYCDFSFPLSDIEIMEDLQ